MASPGGFDKWVDFELKRINRGLVARRKKLSSLLKEENPRCETKDGEAHDFDREELLLISSVLEKGEDLLLPMMLRFSTEARDSCYIDDETAAAVLRRLEKFGEAYQYREGKMWLPNSLAYTLTRKYRSAIQAMFL